MSIPFQRFDSNVTEFSRVFKQVWLYGNFIVVSLDFLNDKSKSFFKCWKRFKICKCLNSPSLCLSVCLSLSLSLPVSVSVCPSVCLSVCLSLSLSLLIRLISAVSLFLLINIKFCIIYCVVLLDSPLRWVEPSLIELNASRRFNGSETGF